MCASMALAALLPPPAAAAEDDDVPAPALHAAGQIELRSIGRVRASERIKLALLALAQDHPDVQAARAAAESSGFDLEAAQRARYPRFKVGTSAGSSSGAGSGAAGYTALTAEARMSVIDGGFMGARIAAAEQQSAAQGEALKTASQQAVLDALTAYLQVQRFALKAEISQRSGAVLDELARVEQRRVDLGATGQSDLRMAASRRASAQARQQEFASQQADALAKFESYFRFAPEPQSLPALVLPPYWDIPSQAEALRTAEAASTELQEADRQIARAQAVVRQQEAARWPTVDAVLSKTRDPQGILYREATRAGVELNWNFGNGFDLQTRIQQALADVASFEAKRETVRRSLIETTSATWGRSQAGRERERALREAVGEAAAAFQGRRRLLDFGRETLLNVLDAQVEYFTLLLDYVDALFDQRTNEFRLARTAGRLWVDPQADLGWVDALFGGPGEVLPGEALGIGGEASQAEQPLVLRPALLLHAI
ncbi:TolC family protein [Xylophilus sp.]|uniref:TolC family protein n=1 Tax=Xylophilus sp. TaxID=2653893 RepID=UPI002D7E7BC0|nr:TolC family protein [Xylophilus sp.]